MQTVPRFNPQRIDKARLAANMSYADLAYAVRRITDGRLKPTEQSIRRWINGTHAPREGVVAAIAAATEQQIGFFYEADSQDEDEGRALLRDLRLIPVEQLPLHLRQRLERFIDRGAPVKS